jgi:signal transduction histidine kinase
MSLEVAADLPWVRGDRLQFQEVVLNLVFNGLEAMEAAHAGDRTSGRSRARASSGRSSEEPAR